MKGAEASQGERDDEHASDGREEEDESEMWFEIDQGPTDIADGARPAVSSGRDYPVQVPAKQDNAYYNANKDVWQGHILEVEYPQGHMFQVMYPEKDIPSATRQNSVTCRQPAQRDLESAASTCPGSPAPFPRATKITKDNAQAALQAANTRQAAAAAAYEAAAAEAAKQLSVVVSLRQNQKRNEFRLAIANAMKTANERQIDADNARYAATVAIQQVDLAAARAWKVGACPNLKPVKSVIENVLNDNLIELEYCKRHHRWRNEILGANVQHANDDLPKFNDCSRGIQQPEKFDVIFCGSGGVGRRAAYGCFGSRRKQKVVRSSGCRVIAKHSFSATTIEFELAGLPTIQLSDKTRVATKDTRGEVRVEMVLEDGRYIWLWRVPSRTSALILGLLAKTSTRWSSKNERLVASETVDLCDKQSSNLPRQEEEEESLQGQIGFDTSRSAGGAGFLPAADALSSEPLNYGTRSNGPHARVPKLRLQALGLHDAMAVKSPQVNTSSSQLYIGAGICCLARCSSNASSSSWLSSTGSASPPIDLAPLDSYSLHPTLDDTSLELASPCTPTQDDHTAIDDLQEECISRVTVKPVEGTTCDASPLQPPSPSMEGSKLSPSGGLLVSSSASVTLEHPLGKQKYREPTPTLQLSSHVAPRSSRPPSLSNKLPHLPVHHVATAGPRTSQAAASRSSPSPD